MTESQRLCDGAMDAKARAFLGHSHTGAFGRWKYSRVTPSVTTVSKNLSAQSVVHSMSPVGTT